MIARQHLAGRRVDHQLGASTSSKVCRASSSRKSRTWSVVRPTVTVIEPAGNGEAVVQGEGEPGERLVAFLLGEFADWVESVLRSAAGEMEPDEADRDRLAVASPSARGARQCRIVARHLRSVAVPSAGHGSRSPHQRIVPT